MPPSGCCRRGRGLSSLTFISLGSVPRLGFPEPCRPGHHGSQRMALGYWCLTGLSRTTQRSVRSLGQRLAQTAARNLPSADPRPVVHHPGQGRGRGLEDLRGSSTRRATVCLLSTSRPRAARRWGTGGEAQAEKPCTSWAGPSLGFRTLVIKSSGFPGRSPEREKPEFLLPAHLLLPKRKQSCVSGTEAQRGAPSQRLRHICKDQPRKKVH